MCRAYSVVFKPEAFDIFNSRSRITVGYEGGRQDFMKNGPKHIQRLAYKYNTFNDVQFSCILSPPMHHCDIHNFNKSVFRKGVTFCVMASIQNWLLSEYEYNT